MGSGDSSVGVLLGEWGNVAVGLTITEGFTSKVAVTAGDGAVILSKSGAPARDTTRQRAANAATAPA